MSLIKRTPRRLSVLQPQRPAYVVWELTLRCDQACAHCGSRAGAARDGELDTNEALGVVEQLAKAGASEVVLIGGEAYLHQGFLDVVRALRRHGIEARMTTGGRGITAENAKAMKEAGLGGVSVSIDGTRAAHDAIRRTPGSFDAAVRALGHFKAAGIHTAANTHVNRVNKSTLPQLFAFLVEQGVKAWQVQITVPLGRGADRPEMLLQPWDLLEVVPTVAALKEVGYRHGVVVMPGNNLGYFGKEEATLRSLHEGGRDHWQGCQAGRFVMGIEAHGAVKGCPSLPSDAYVVGNVRDRSVDEIWQDAPGLHALRARDGSDLWGGCSGCAYASVCRGGCTFTAHALFGRAGNNPYCHHRAHRLAQQGLRERLVPAAPAPGRPFDHGTFDVVVEALGAPDAVAEAPLQLVRIGRAA